MITENSVQNNPIMVRRATADDAPTVLTLIDALADYEQLERPTDDARKRLIEDGFVRTPPRFDVLLAETTENHQAIGYAIIFETYSSFLARPTLYIEDFFVLPEARKLGAGSALFNQFLEEARLRSCGRIEWVCLEWNQLAIDFYEKRGAEHLREWRTYRLNEAAFNRSEPDSAR